MITKTFLMDKTFHQKGNDHVQTGIITGGSRQKTNYPAANRELVGHLLMALYGSTVFLNTTCEDRMFFVSYRDNDSKYKTDAKLLHSQSLGFLS